MKVLKGELSGAGGWSSPGVGGNVPGKDRKGVLREAQGPGVRQWGGGGKGLRTRHHPGEKEAGGRRPG